MSKNEFIGIRVEAGIQESIMGIVRENDEFKTMTDFARQALTKLISEIHQYTDQEKLSHPVLPEFIKVVNTLKNEEVKRFLFELINIIKFEEIYPIYNLVKRYQLKNQSVKL